MYIFDFGSGETCKNDKSIIREMIDKLTTLCDKYGYTDTVIKWQLFNYNSEIDYIKPLTESNFDYAYKYAEDKGYRTTASVFSKKDVDFLSNYDVPFYKIACAKKIYPLIDHIPDYNTILISVSDTWLFELYSYMNLPKKLVRVLCGVRKYPSYPIDYGHFDRFLSYGISDHTDGFSLLKYEPNYYETHFKLMNSKGKDNGVWAKTPSQIEKHFSDRLNS